MTLIQLDDGRKLNAENITMFRPLKSGAFEFYMADGGTIAGDVDDPETSFFPIVPAAGGFRTVDTDIINGERFYTFKPVVAWRICPAGNFPLTAGRAEEQDGCAAIMCPSGEIIDAEGNHFGSLNEFQALVAEEDEERLAKA